MKIRRKVVLAICLVIVLLFVVIATLPFLGRRNEMFYYRVRVSALQELLYLADNTNPQSLSVLASAHMGRGVLYPYDHTCPGMATMALEWEPDYYQKVLRYKIIRCDDWWGIIELEYGIIGKYFLMITKDGDIIRFDKPFLPEQKLAEYPPKYDIEKHIYPAYLDKFYPSKPDTIISKESQAVAAPTPSSVSKTSTARNGGH